MLKSSDTSSQVRPGFKQLRGLLIGTRMNGVPASQEKHCPAQPATGKANNTGNTPTGSSLSKIKGDGLPKVNTHQNLQNKPDKFIITAINSLTDRV